MTSLERYVTLDADDPDAFIELEVHYDQADLEDVYEGTLTLYAFDDEWSPLESTLDESEQVVGAELTSTVVVGLFGEAMDDTPPPEPTPTPTPTMTPTPDTTPTPGADAPIPGLGILATVIVLVLGGYLLLWNRGRAK